MINIDHLTTEVYRKMNQDGSLETFSLKLAIQNTNSARARCCYQRIQEYQLFPNKQPGGSKDDKMSAKYRDVGNGFFKKKLDRQALYNYNLAIMYASSDNLICLGYANRSAVLYEMKSYEDCLIDIERALACKDNEDLKPKLLRRKITCEEAMSKVKKEVPIIEETRKRIFTLPETRMEGVPCASGVLEITHTSSMGRCIVAKEDISPGQVLAVEKPYLTILLQSYYVDRCYNCCGLNRSKIPCDGCTFVMFCNDTCKTESWNSYHKFECPMMFLLTSLNFSKIELLTLRTLLRARTDHSSWNELFEVIKLAESENDPKLRGFVKDKEGNLVYDSKYYTAIHMLETNESKRNVSDIFNRGVTAAIFLNMLKKYTDFFKDCLKDDEDVLSLDQDHYFWLAGSLLIHHNMTSASNMHSLESLLQGKDLKYVLSCNFGSAAYAFLSLLNHSCSPNVGRILNNGLEILLALRPIRKGQQIFDNYGSHHALHTYNERQNSLQFQYKFKCKCEACSESWPLYPDLNVAVFKTKRSKKKFRNILTKEIITCLEKGDKTIACDIINRLYEDATTLEECSPCKELADYQETIKQCWALLSEIVYYDGQT